MNRALIEKHIIETTPHRRLDPPFPGLGLAVLSGLAWLGAAVIFGLALEPVSLWLRGWLI